MGAKCEGCISYQRVYTDIAKIMVCLACSRFVREDHYQPMEIPEAIGSTDQDRCGQHKKTIKSCIKGFADAMVMAGVKSKLTVTLESPADVIKIGNIVDCETRLEQDRIATRYSGVTFARMIGEE